MSEYGVRVRFVNLLVRGQGVVSDREYSALIDYAQPIVGGRARAVARTW